MIQTTRAECDVIEESKIEQKCDLIQVATCSSLSHSVTHSAIFCGGAETHITSLHIKYYEVQTIFF